jgi:hypothetical protein
MKFDPSCRHQWIVTRWNIQEKYRVAEMLTCQSCLRIQSFQDAVDNNHLHESINSLWDLVQKYKPNGGIDPDNLRGVFLTYLNRGSSIPDAMQLIKAQYDLYPPDNPQPDEDIVDKKTKKKR